MFKTSEEIIVIQAEATTPIPTGVVFWSHDKGTAKLIIQLKKDHINQTLPQGTIVPILLEFNSDTAANGRGRHIYHAVIEDALEGIVSIVLEDNILGYVGRVDGSVYIELPDSRSLDTAGRFTFDIKRSPIDEDVPELEDYYWQGFNEIIQESKRLIDQVESNCETVLNDLSSKVTSLENQTSDIKSKQAEILKSIEEHDVFTKQESSANVIYQLVGKEKVRMTFTADFSNKESGSDDKNPHWASAVYGLNELPSPSDFKTELVQLRYDSLKILDGQKTTVNTVAGTANQYPCLEHKWDIVEIIKRKLSEDFFVDRGAIDKASQATVAKKIIVSPLESSAWGFGTCPSGNSLKIANHINGVGWQTDQLPPNTTNLVKQITARNTATPSIDDEGFLRTIIYTEASSKTVQSQINVDYGNLVFSIEISMNEHIKSMMAANHVENLATQDEAETGEDNTKTMTPLRVFQSIAQWTKNKFISLTENETVLGIKNFANGLQVGGNNVLSQNGVKRLYLNSTQNSSFNAGSATFVRYGDYVTLFLNFQVRSSGDLARDANVVADTIIDDIYEPHENFHFFIGTESNQAVVKFVGKAVKANSVLTSSQWYVGTVTYLAKNKL
ncbi:BppU family phage baseplate upper protein [Enterococcus avium]|uniref:BppU family phage baseplate upper protein n=1 Tax=Enterococcus avium TaxID=33945 RepID=UPI0032E4D758